MSILIKPPPPNVPVVDGRGIVTLPWDLFFKALVDRTGGVDAPTNSELAVALHDDAGIEESKADIYRLRDQMNATPPVVQVQPAPEPDALVQALYAVVAEMRREIDALKAGTVL